MNRRNFFKAISPLLIAPAIVLDVLRRQLPEKPPEPKLQEIKFDPALYDGKFDWVNETGVDGDMMKAIYNRLWATNPYAELMREGKL